MARSVNATIEQTTPRGHLQRGFPFEDIPEGIIEVEDVTAGMINRLPRDKVPKGSGRDIKNGRVRDDWVGRRPGTAVKGTTPDANQVVLIVSFIRESGDAYLCRITQSTFHVWRGGDWVAFTIEDGGFSGKADRMTVSQFFDRMYLADGIDELWEVDFSTSKVSKVDGSPRGQFTITFADRILVGNLREAVGGERPNKIRWCVNGNPNDWTGLGSGEEDLAARDLGDEIMGMFDFEDQAVVLRRRSIMHLTRQPFADAPFRFTTVVRGMGCDLPYTGVKIPGAIIYADQGTRDVYIYSPGSRPQPIASGINRSLYEDLASTEFAEATWNPFEKEYHLGLSWETTGTIQRVWVFNLENQAWSYDDSPEITTLGRALTTLSQTAIDDLVGTIDGLSGSIDELGTSGILTSAMYKGTLDGKVLEQSFASDNDHDATAFEFLFSSPNFGSLSRRRTLKELRLQLDVLADGSVTLEADRDEDAATWQLSKTAALTAAVSGSTLQTLGLGKRQLSADHIFWRIKSTAPKIRLKNWWARVLEKGFKKPAGRQA